MLASAYIREQRPAEAVQVYVELLQSNPGDVDVWIMLGNLYWLAGSPATAETVFTRVFATIADTDDRPVSFALPEFYQQTDWIEPYPLTSDALLRLADRLRPEMTSARVAAFWAAAEMPGTIISGQSAEDDLEVLMPAVIDRNIRQARAAGQIDLANALQSLHNAFIRPNRSPWVNER